MTNLVLSIVGLLVTNWVPFSDCDMPGCAVYHPPKEQRQVFYLTVLRVHHEGQSWDLELARKLMELPVVTRDVPEQFPRSGWWMPGLVITNELMPEIRIWTNTNLVVYPE